MFLQDAKVNFVHGNAIFWNIIKLQNGHWEHNQISKWLLIIQKSSVCNSVFNDPIIHLLTCALKCVLGKTIFSFRHPSFQMLYLPYYWNLACIASNVLKTRERGDKKPLPLKMFSQHYRKIYQNMRVCHLAGREVTHNF